LALLLPLFLVNAFWDDPLLALAHGVGRMIAAMASSGRPALVPPAMLPIPCFAVVAVGVGNSSSCQAPPSSTKVRGTNG